MKAIFRKTTCSALAVLLAAALLIGLLPLSASAAYSGDANNTFTFTDSGVTASEADGSGFKIEGTALTISEAGTYRITGSCSDGSVQVKKGTTGVTLILDNLTLTASDTAPLSCNKSTEVTIYISGTVTLTDAEDPADEKSTDEAVADAFEGAAIKVKSGASVVITGTGTLTADGSACKNGIKGAATASITVGASASDTFTLNIKAANHGLASDGSVTIVGGKVNITAGNEGIKSEPDEDDTESEGVVTMTGGTVTVNSVDDGVKGYKTVAITGGTLNIASGDDGIKCEYDVILGTEGSSAGPVINITKSNEGIEGAAVTFYSGSGTIVATDDGVNAANSDLTNYSFLLTVAGGTWIVDAGGDGLDSNGNLVSSGGSMTVYGSANNGNAAIDIGDFGCSWTVSGGEIAAVGMSGMMITSTSGTYVLFGSSGMMGGFGGGTGSSVSIRAGSTLAVKDSAGNTLWSGTATKSANCFLYAGSALTSGGSYTLYVNGSAAATATATAGNGQGQQPGQGGQPGQGQQPPEQGQQPPEQGQQPPEQGQQPGRPGQGVGGFQDVNPSAYYAAAVQWAVQQGVTNGTGPAAFSPDGSCTRAQAVTFLWRAAGSPTPTSTTCPFTDVDATGYYYKAVLWAYENGITLGTSGTAFSPDATVTRAQVVTFLQRALKGSASGANPFSDVAASDYFYDAVLWAVANGITNGTGANTFSPDKTCTRAEIVTFLFRAMRTA